MNHAGHRPLRFGLPISQVAAYERHPRSLGATHDDNQCPPVFRGKRQCLADGLVEVYRFRPDQFRIPGVRRPIDEHIPDEEEESLFMLIQKRDGQPDGFGEQRAPPFADVGYVFFCREARELPASDVFHFVKRSGDLETLGAEFSGQVPPVFPVAECGEATADEDIQGRTIDVGRCNLLGHHPAFHMGNEGSDAAFQQSVGGDDARRQAVFRGVFGDRLHRASLDIEADSPLACRDARSHRRAVCRSVAVEVGSRMGLDDANRAHLLDVQRRLVGNHARLPLGEAHAVADEEDDVGRLLCGRLGSLRPKRAEGEEAGGAGDFESVEQFHGAVTPPSSPRPASWPHPGCLCPDS